MSGDAVSGVTEFSLDLNNYGGFGTYIFKSVITAYGERTSEDAVKFKYTSVETPDDEVEEDEDGGVEFEICYAAGTQVISMTIYSEDSETVIKELPDYIVKNPETGGCETIKIDPGDIDIASGEYTIIIETYDNIDKDGDPTGTITIRFKHTAPDAPNVPDTGALLSSLNISKSDFLITGVLGFTVISLIALFVMKRNSKR